MQRLMHLLHLRRILQECQPGVHTFNTVTKADRCIARLTDRIVAMVLQATDELDAEVYNHVRIEEENDQ